MLIFRKSNLNQHTVTHLGNESSSVKLSNNSKETDAFENPTAQSLHQLLWFGKKAKHIDLQKVNSKTETDRYTIPCQDRIFSSLKGARYFMILDANKGYHQFELDEQSRKLTAFITEDHGLWEWVRVCFGLKNAPAFFQRCIDQILKNLSFEFVLAYLDDLIIFSKTFEEHL